ncbi:C-C motif chemokine 1 [Monodon monoceros]|uniref:C-C motif chemokine 1 n=1 Tax=Monodon monoceros TaxID=40151 RepID=UPI0010F5FAF4|nr:C-C motif chemokine 1 [Monodon monoceros]
MKVITAALVCLLLARAWLQDVDAKSMHVSSSNCCFTLVERKMPLQRIQCYKNTSSTCSYKNHLMWPSPRLSPSSFGEPHSVLAPSGPRVVTCCH